MTSTYSPWLLCLSIAVRRNGVVHLAAAGLPRRGSQRIHCFALPAGGSMARKCSNRASADVGLHEGGE